jgi:Gamma-glutamyltranspeptidase
MALSKEKVPLLADEEQVLEIVHPLRPRPKTWEWRTPNYSPVHATNPWSRFQTWKVVLRCMVLMVLSPLIFLFVTWTERSDLSSEISIRHPPPTLPGWPAKHNPAYLVRARHGAAATENVLCSNIAVDVLKDGGNAVDASIAATLCVGVVSMYRYCLFCRKICSRSQCGQFWNRWRWVYDGTHPGFVPRVELRGVDCRFS